MSITIDQKSRTVLVNIDKVDKLLERNIKQVLHKVGARLKRTASKNILKRPRFGRKYRIPGRRRLHT